MKKFYNTICFIYRLWTNIVRWSKVETRTLIYEWIKCSIYQKTQRYWQTSQAIQTDSNSFNMVVDKIYYWLAIWDIVEIAWKTYKIMNSPLAHQRANGQIDNYEFTISITT